MKRADKKVNIEVLYKDRTRTNDSTATEEEENIENEDEFNGPMV